VAEKASSVSELIGDPMEKRMFEYTQSTYIAEGVAADAEFAVILPSQEEKRGQRIEVTDVKHFTSER
jgi:hypothetical protein